MFFLPDIESRVPRVLALQPPWRRSGPCLSSQYRPWHSGRLPSPLASRPYHLTSPRRKSTFFCSDSFELIQLFPIPNQTVIQLHLFSTTIIIRVNFSFRSSSYTYAKAIRSGSSWSWWRASSDLRRRWKCCWCSRVSRSRSWSRVAGGLNKLPIHLNQCLYVIL